jgi:tRNA uridine 5-carbamoylmethylation protein Kti12
MKTEFEEKYPPQLVLSLPHKKFNKLHGQARNTLNQQSNKVDRVCMKVFEEHVKRHLETIQTEGKIKKSVLKKVARQFVEGLNSSAYKAYQNALREAFKGMKDVLGGGLPKQIGRGDGEQSS